MQDFNLSFYFQPAHPSQPIILPLYLFIELMLRHVQQLLHPAPSVVHWIDDQRSLPVEGLQILKCLDNPEPTTSVKEVFEVFPPPLSYSIPADMDVAKDPRHLSPNVSTSGRIFGSAEVEHTTMGTLSGL